MIADSVGKDSADVLMIMMIYAIILSGYFRYLNLNKQTPKIILATRDHFAVTYQGILQS